MYIYLDNAATSSPKPQAVIDEVRRALVEYNANPGRSAHAPALAAAHCVYAAREAIARLIGAAQSSSVAFASNCTDALNLAIKGCLRRGDHVISTLLEHNSVLRPLSMLHDSGQIELTLIPPRPDGFIYPEDIRRSLRKNTRLIAVTHASNVTGAIQPVAAIGQMANAHGVLYLIDGAQALGGMPVDVKKLGCSFYAFPGHKSLLGPQGTGGLYIRPAEPPERYEAGTLNLPGVAGLWRGAEHVRENLSRIMMSEREVASQLYAELRKMHGVEIYSPDDEAARAGIVSFNLGDLSSSEAADALARRNIAVRGGLHCAPGAHRFLGTLRRGAVRASVGHATTSADIDALLSAVAEILKKGE